MLVLRHYLKGYITGELKGGTNIGPTGLFPHFFSSKKISSLGQKALISYFMLEYLEEFNQ